MHNVDLDLLRADYLSLINDQLPAAAKIGKFPIRLNHCMARVVLDNLFGGVWYQFLDRKSKIPAYKQLNIHQLTRAIEIATTMLDRDTICQLNQNSLKWRSDAKSTNG